MKGVTTVFKPTFQKSSLINTFYFTHQLYNINSQKWQTNMHIKTLKERKTIILLIVLYVLDMCDIYKHKYFSVLSHLIFQRKLKRYLVYD